MAKLHLLRKKEKKENRLRRDASLSHTHTQLSAIIHTHMNTLPKSFYTNPDNERGREKRCEHSSGIA